MIDKDEFSDMKGEMESSDSKREEIITLSRKIITVSKQLINSVQRSELKEAERLAEKIKKQVSQLPEENVGIGLQRVALQEYVEAMCFLGYARGKKLPSRKELGVGTEEYILGVCDLTGEVVRLAVNSVIKGDNAKAMEIKDFVAEIYGELIKFDFRNGDMRRKFDSIKWHLNKLEDLALEIKLKGQK